MDSSKTTIAAATGLLAVGGTAAYFYHKNYRNDKKSVAPRAVLLGIASSDGAPLAKVSQQDAMGIAERDALASLDTPDTTTDGAKKWKATSDVVKRVYNNSKIHTRHCAANLIVEDKSSFGTVDERLNRARIVMEEVATGVARRAMKKSLVTPEAIGRIVVVSSTVLAEPGVSCALVKKLGIPMTCERTSVAYMGCAAAMTGLRVAEDYVSANPGKCCLLVSYELPSVHAKDAAATISALITHAIFGDGCAAAVVCAEGSPFFNKTLAAGKSSISIKAKRSALIPESSDGIVLNIQPKGIDCLLSKHLPRYIEENCAGYVDALLADAGVAFDDVGFWAIHPGGRRIIEAAQAAIGLENEDVEETWEVLAERGNMLSPSILFVLEKILNKRAKSKHTGKQYGMGFSFAPGVSVEGFLFECNN